MSTNNRITSTTPAKKRAAQKWRVVLALPRGSNPEKAFDRIKEALEHFEIPAALSLQGPANAAREMDSDHLLAFLQWMTRSAFIPGPAETTAYIIGPDVMELARALVDKHIPDGKILLDQLNRGNGRAGLLLQRDDLFRKGAPVHSGEGELIGHTTGTQRRCQGCGGPRIGVRRPIKRGQKRSRIIWLCSKDFELHDTHFQIA